MSDGQSHSLILLNSPVKANILIDQAGRPRLADFGLLTIIMDPTNPLTPSSHTQGGSARWMSPELLAPKQFGLNNSRPTEHSDCYALAMVIYETISGNLPFHEDTDPTVIVKVLDGKRPSARGGRFTRGLWGMLERCWGSQPSSRPAVKDVLQFLEMFSHLPESPSEGESGASTTTSSDSSHVVIRSPSPIQNPSPQIDVNDMDNYWVSTIQSYAPPTPRVTGCVGPGHGFSNDWIV